MTSRGVNTFGQHLGIPHGRFRNDVRCTVADLGCCSCQIHFGGQVLTTVSMFVRRWVTRFGSSLRMEWFRTAVQLVELRLYMFPMQLLGGRII